MYKVCRARKVLNMHKHADGGWFWIKYSAVPYIGCEWGCGYCYSRDEKYNPHKASRDPEVLKFEDPFSEYIKIKENAPELLRNDLRGKPIDLVCLDGYQPIDAKYQYARKMLEVCLDLGFPVFINEKSPILLRDSDVLEAINERSYVNVGWSIITTTDDSTREAFESKAPPVSSRFAAMGKLAKRKIMTGTVFMPILPFIYDNEDNIEAVVRRTKECGGQYVLDAGLTLWGHCKTHFYGILRAYDSSLVREYDALYTNSARLASHTAHVHELVSKHCRRYGLLPHIPRPVAFFPPVLRLNKKIAEQFYLKARELQLAGEERHKQWAYQKGAWALDDLKESIVGIYNKEGITGLLKIKGIGKSLAAQIEEYVKKAPA